MPQCIRNGCSDPHLEDCTACADHCNHYICSGCNAHDPEDTCGHCEYCSSCCSCQECSTCSRLVHEYDTCGHCSRHCSCDDEDEQEEHQYGRARPAPANSVFAIKRTIGVEWEYNDANADLVNDWRRTWGGGIHSDGSCGWEAVTPPIAGDHIQTCLTDLGKALATASIDPRCGIHVHVDVSDYTWADMYRLLEVYAKVEPILYLLAGQHRANNTYCRPCGGQYLQALQADDRKGAVLGVAFSNGPRTERDEPRPQAAAVARTHQRGRPGKKDGGRYRGLNICPWLAGKKHKAPDTTVEFRMHRNTSDATRVIGWAQTVVQLIEWAAKASAADVRNLPRSSLRALMVICPLTAPWILSRVRTWKKATQRKRRVARHITVTGGMYRIKPPSVSAEAE